MNHLDSLARKAEQDSKGVLGSLDADYLRAASAVLEAVRAWHEKDGCAYEWALLVAFDKLADLEEENNI